jgi:hypothetical protein
MPSSTSDRVELADNAPVLHCHLGSFLRVARFGRSFQSDRQPGSGPPVQSAPSGSHGSKKPRTGSGMQEGPVVASSGESSCKLNTPGDGAATELPTGVINIFPSKNDKSRCCCPTQPQRAALAPSDLAQIFVSQYGAENLAYLQDKEGREYPSKSPTTNRVPNISSAPSMLASPAHSPKEDVIDSKLAGYGTPLFVGVTNAKFLPPFGGEENAEFLEKMLDYLPKQPWVTARMRAILVSWLVEVTADLDISEEAFHVAISILDKVLRSGATKELYRANPGYDWDANFFCVRVSELQALGWYVLALKRQRVSSCQEWIFRSLPCDSLFPVLAYGWGASCEISPDQTNELWH